MASATSTVPPACSGSVPFPFRLSAVHAAGSHLITGHEAQQPDQDGADFPRRVEGSRVKVGNTEAEPRGRLETRGGSVHAYGWRGEWICGREDEGTPVLTVFIRGGGRPGEDIVPSSSHVAC